MGTRQQGERGTQGFGLIESHADGAGVYPAPTSSPAPMAGGFLLSDPHPRTNTQRVGARRLGRREGDMSWRVCSTPAARQVNSHGGNDHLQYPRLPEPHTARPLPRVCRPTGSCPPIRP